MGYQAEWGFFSSFAHGSGFVDANTAWKLFLEFGIFLHGSYDSDAPSLKNVWLFFFFPLALRLSLGTQKFS